MKNIKTKNKLWIYITAYILSVIIGAFAFLSLANTYKKSTYIENEKYLINLTNQIKLYVSESLSNNWKITETLKESIEYESYDSTDELLTYINKQILLWGISNIYLVNEDGTCIDKDGIAGASITKDEALDYLYKTRNSKENRYFFTQRGYSNYIIEVDSNNKIDNKKIVAVIVSKDLELIIGSIDSDFFDDEAFVYLADNNGVIYSQNYISEVSFNIYNLFKNSKIANTDKTFDEIKLSNTIESFSIDADENEKYIIVFPTMIIDKMWKIVYAVPVSSLNETTNSFYSNLIWISSILLIIVSVSMFISFVNVYRGQKNRLNARIEKRERMINLLIKQTNYVFGLIKIDETEPIYISSNYFKYVYKEIFSIERVDGVYKIRDNNQIPEEDFNNINDELSKWNGVDIFKTPPIKVLQNNEERYISISLYPTNEKSDEYILISSDITNDIAKENTLIESLNLANSANKAKTEFLANMSHDIRTPMNAILNMTDFAINNIDDKNELINCLSVVKKSSVHLLKLINDILEVSRIESGKTVFERESININEKLDNTQSVIKALCDYKQQTLECDFDKIKHTLLIGDSLKLSQILINILNNAVKFTSTGGKINFIVEELKSLKSEIVPLKFTIIDNGIGIEESNLKTIFDPFTRSNKNIVKNIEGTGLGLTIAKNYIEGMGGHIEISSEVDKGTKVVIEIPFERDNYIGTNKNIELIDKDIDFHNIRALLVEDNEINSVISKMLLESININVEIAVNGKIAVDMFEAHEKDYYDIIYMDVQMPVMSGYEATTLIRSKTDIGGDTIPIIAMTANVFQEDIENARSHGMNAHIGKPINKNELINVTSNFIKRSK